MESLGRDKLGFELVTEAAIRVGHYEPESGKTQDVKYKLPQRGTQYSAGYDFYAPYDILIPAMGKSALVKTGVKVYLPESTYLSLKTRSSLGTKHDIILSNIEGVIDRDYVDNLDNEGEIMVMFRNLGTRNYVIKQGEKMCQGVITPFATMGEQLDTVRSGGFGSTGV